MSLLISYLFIYLYCLLVPLLFKDYNWPYRMITVKIIFASTEISTTLFLFLKAIFWKFSFFRRARKHYFIKME